ncbi:MAG TPA: hypothetical protein VG935_05160 [Patescibacteria group bacterium]|nr:hypothetical protein [Patescibacteria group bacterium]
MPKLKLWLPFMLIAGVFLAIKLHSLSIRASDTNIYWYTAKEILEGKTLYKDIFFTNFPIIPYVASLYYLLSGGNLLFYYFTAALESVTTGAILYWIVVKQSSSQLLAGCTAMLYLFSFMLLSTSDHQTGVFLAALFVIASYASFFQKKYILMGVLTALALLTKAYTLPLLLTYIVILFLENRKALGKFLVAFSTSTFVVLLPSFLFAGKDLWHDVFAYSLTRSQGVSKIGIVWFALQHDFLLVGLLFLAIIMLKRQKTLGIFSLLSLLFFIFYKDIYYLYLNVTLPLICLVLPQAVTQLKKYVSINKFMVPTILLLFISYNLWTYLVHYTTLQNLPLSSLTTEISTIDPPVLYGVNGIAPALAFLTRKPLLNSIVDTNDNIFRKGFLNATSLTDSAIAQHALVITEGVYYPEANIKQDILTDIVNSKRLTSQCKLDRRFPFYSEGVINEIVFFRC